MSAGAAAGSHPTLTSVLQDTFHKIETLGSAAFGTGQHGNKAYLHQSHPVAVPLPSSSASRVTDSIFGNPVHDIHKVRVPSIIHEDAGKLALPGVEGRASASASASGTADQNAAASRKKYIIGIIIVCLLLLAVIGALFFIRRRNRKRAQEEAELAEAAEEQFRQRMLLHNVADLQQEDDLLQMQPQVAKRPMQPPVQPPMLMQSPPTVQILAQPPVVPIPPTITIQAAAPPLEAPAPKLAPITVSRTPTPVSSAPPPLASPSPLPLPSPSPSPLPLLSPTPTPTPTPSPIMPPPEKVLSSSSAKIEADAENEIESAVARTLDTRRRLETLRQQLDAGIQSVVGNVSESVAKTIASQRAFSAHSSEQEYDEKVLLNTGTPNISTVPLDATDLPSISLLDNVSETHPELAQSIGENI